MLKPKKIISDTMKVFEKELANINNFVSYSDYKHMHKSFLTPTSIIVDMDSLQNELQSYQTFFQQWGNNHTHLSRSGIALVNLDGVLSRTQDPTNGSLYEYNALHPKNKIIESDCVVPTELINLPSIKPLRIFDGHWCRSNILKWGNGAKFFPHIDNCIPAPWLRLWATNDPNNLHVSYYNTTTESMEKIQDVEKGRLYLIDTSIVHDAEAFEDDIYQLFLSTLPTAKNLVKGLLNV